MSDQQVCVSCKFYLVEQGARICRRNPPAPVLIPASMVQPAGIMGIWPRTEAEYWCGEWKTKEAGGGVVTLTGQSSHAPQPSPGADQFVPPQQL